MASATRMSLRRIAAMLRPHATGEGRSFATGAALAVATVGLHVLQPWPLKWIVDHLATAAGVAPAAGVAGWVSASPERGIALLSLLFVGLAIAVALASYGQSLVLNGMGNRVLYRFRAQLFMHVLRQPLAFHEAREVGELMTRVVYDTSRLRRGLNGILTSIVQTLALFVASFVVLLWIDWTLAVVLALGGGVALVMMRRRGRRIAYVARKQRTKEGLLAALVGSELMAVRELQTFGLAGSAVSTRFAARNDHSLRQEQKLQRLSLGLTLRVDVAIAVSVAAAMWLGAAGEMRGQLTAGDLVLFLSYALSLRAPFSAFALQTARLGRTFACADRLDRIVRRPSSIQDLPGAIDAVGVRGALRFESVSLQTPKRRRGGRKWSLDAIDGVLPEGQRIAVLGGNGAGKSTLLSLVLRLADPARGRVWLDERDLRDYAVDSLRSQMSVVFQDSVLTGVSVRDNIALGVPGATLEAIQRAAETADVARFIERLPQGYDTLVRRGGDLFSGGERQRLALARALLRDGRIWLLDEPTTGLDRASATALTTRLLEVTRGRTVLWVTHDPELLPHMDWVLELAEGRVAFSGPATTYAGRRAGADPAATIH